MIGIKDPLRDGIKRAIEICHGAGVTVRMLTYDSISTAITIAK
jgi:Ca2+-transporting ATPase